MPKYMVTGSYSLDGVKEIVTEGASSRVEAARQLFEAVGGSLEAMYFAFGSDDVVIIFDVPDNVSVAALSLLVVAKGALEPKVTVLMTPDEVDQAAEIAASFLVPAG